jgi:selenocysteine lyase/cysteine desulfurase
MQKDNIDVLCIASHKGLYAFSGTGIIINQSGKKMNTIIEGGTGSNSFSLLQPDIMPDVLESGTQNVGGIISIYYGIKEIEKIGIDKIQNHEMKLIQTAYNSFKDMGNIILYTNYPTTQTHVPVLSFNINGLDSEETVAKLSDMGFCLRAGLHCAPMAHYAFKTDKIGTVRLAPSMFTSQKDIKDLINAVKSIKYL